MVITLPWPPSVNHYWIRKGKGYCISPKGIKFRREVYYLSREAKININSKNRLFIEIDAFPPDKRKRDLDNLLKSLLDALQYANVYEDDNQIDKILITRKNEYLNKLEIKISIL